MVQSFNVDSIPNKIYTRKCVKALHQMYGRKFCFDWKKKNTFNDEGDLQVLLLLLLLVHGFFACFVCFVCCLFLLFVVLFLLLFCVFSCLFLFFARRRLFCFCFVLFCFVLFSVTLLLFERRRLVVVFSPLKARRRRGEFLNVVHQEWNGPLGPIQY